MNKITSARRLDVLFEGYALDLDGTVYLGDHLLDHAAEVVAKLRDRSSVVFVTNKPLETAEAYATKLTNLGIATESTDVVTPLDSLVYYLNDHHPGVTILTVAEQLVDDVLRAAGFKVTADPFEAGLIVVSFDRTFNYAKLLAAYRAVNNGATIVATNPDPFCPTPDGGFMVGDRLLTDIAMAKALGMSSVLMLTGVTSVHELSGSEVQPDFVARDLLDLLPNGLDGP